MENKKNCRFELRGYTAENHKVAHRVEVYKILGQIGENWRESLQQ